MFYKIIYKKRNNITIFLVVCSKSSIYLQPNIIQQ